MFLGWKNNTVKMNIIPNTIYRFKLQQITTTFFTELEQKISQFIWKQKRLWIAKGIFRKNGSGGINLSEFRLNYKATVIKQYITGTNTEI